MTIGEKQKAKGILVKRHRKLRRRIIIKIIILQIHLQTLTFNRLVTR